MINRSYLTVLAVDEYENENYLPGIQAHPTIWRKAFRMCTESESAGTADRPHEDPYVKKGLNAD